MNNDELKHYGIMGMKWGVRRNIRNLNNAKKKGNTAKQEKSLNNLEKHYNKISNKANRYDDVINNTKKLQYKINTKYKPKVSKWEYNGSYYENKADRTRNEQKREKYKEKSDKYYKKARMLKNRYTQFESDLERNKAIRDVFKQYLSEVDGVLIQNGRKILEDKNNKRK